jgi:hypothetical protein
MRTKSDVLKRRPDGGVRLRVSLTVAATKTHGQPTAPGLLFRFCRISGVRYPCYNHANRPFTFLNDESLYLGTVNTPRDKAFLAVITLDAVDGERKVISSSVVSVGVSTMKRIIQQG